MRGNYLVYAMKVTEKLATQEFWNDPRFECKKPDMFHNWVSASGDNIYELLDTGKWRQLNSYHSHSDGSRNKKHIQRDTGVPKILISEEFVYFGGEGPKLPVRFRDNGNNDLICRGRNYRRIKSREVITAFEDWYYSLDSSGYMGKPWDWMT